MAYELNPPSELRTGDNTGLYSGAKFGLEPIISDQQEQNSTTDKDLFTPPLNSSSEGSRPVSDQMHAPHNMHHENITTIDQSQVKNSPPAPNAEADQEEMKADGDAEIEPKLFVDVNVANFGL